MLSLQSMFKKRCFRTTVEFFLTFYRKFMQSLFEFHFNFRSIKIWFSYNFSLTRRQQKKLTYDSQFYYFSNQKLLWIFDSSSENRLKPKGRVHLPLDFSLCSLAGKNIFIQSVCGLCSLWETWTSQNSFQQN